MDKWFSVECPYCSRSHTISRRKIGTILWHNRTKAESRAYGNEVIRSGDLILDCGNKLRLLRCIVHEYPGGFARKQVVMDEDRIVSETTFIAKAFHLNETISKKHPYGTTFPNRRGGDYFILDTLVNGYAVKLVNNMLRLMGTPIHNAFPTEVFPGLPKVDARGEYYLPATVCCCMNIESRKFSFAMSKKLPKTISGKLRTELNDLGYDPNRESKSTKNNCPYYVGHCSEVNAANKILRKKSTDLNNLIFSIAVRPRTMQIIEPCINCATIFPNL